MAHHLTTQIGGDGSKARIPTLIHRTGKVEASANTNSDKGQVLAKVFFPEKPPADAALENCTYLDQCESKGSITTEQIKVQLKKLKPFKAPGPDGILNVVLTKSADLIVARMLPIYKAMLDKSLMYKLWKEFATVVLRKPSKPRYDMPKAYRPIALLNTMWKVITAIIANHITYITKKHQLLPTNHFGGCPGQSTTDTMHLLTNKIKAAWRAGKVMSVLFLDIEGTFLNMNPEKLVHNLRKQRVPTKYTSFVHNILRERFTTLKFDGYVSDRIPIDNGIGQGDPLSMVLYQYYNMDLLDIPKCTKEDAVAYMDDTFMLASCKDFQSAHCKLAAMMGRAGGVEEWSKTYSSPLEYSKLTLINFTHRCKDTKSPTLYLPRRTIKLVESTKYLGVIFDRNLNWKAHQAYAVEKGAKWAAQIRRLMQPMWGITPNYAKCLYTSIALPRVLYAVDIWCTPMNSKHVGPKTVGSAKAIKQITSIQRAGALVIMGGLRTSAMDALNASAFLLPAPLLIRK